MRGITQRENAYAPTEKTTSFRDRLDEAAAGFGDHQRAEDKDAKDIVDDGSAENDAAFAAASAAHLLERFGRDAHGGRCENGAEEERVHRRQPGSDAHAVAGNQRQDHATDGDHEGRSANRLDADGVRFETGEEHQQDDADFAQVRHEGVLADHAKHGGTCDESRDDHTEH